MRHLLTIIFFLGVTQLTAQLVTTVAGLPEIAGSNDGAAFSATFNNPHGIAVGLDGVVYVADRWSHTIRKIELDGTVSTIAGTVGVTGSADGVGESAQFNEPWGICVDHQGDIYVADTRNNKIRKVTPDGIVSTYAGSGNYGTSDGLGTSSTFGNPTGIESDNQGNIYVADHLTHIIRKIDSNGLVSTIAGKPYQGGDLDGIGNQASFKRPYGLTLDLDGNIIVADEWNHKIRRVTPDGEVTTIAGNGLEGSNDGQGALASFNFPWDVTVDSSGTIYVADGYNFTIRRITTDGQVNTYAGVTGVSGAVDAVGTTATFSGATAVALSPLTNEIYVGDAYNHLIRKITDNSQGVSLSLTSGSTTMCQGDFIELTAFPNSFDTYHFYVGNSPIQSSSNPIFEINNLPPGVHTLQVLAVSGSDSYTSNTIEVEVLEPIVPTVSVVGPTTFFEGDSVILIASFGSDYFWSNGETTATITVFDQGEYTVEVTDINGCVGVSDPISIVVQTIPDAAVISIIEGDTLVCSNETTTLTSNITTGTIQWLRDGWGITDATEQNYEVTSNGIYQVQITDAGGFVTVSNTITITFLPEFEIDFNASATVEDLDYVFNFQATPGDIISAEWNFGDGNTSTEISPNHQYTEIGLYSITLIATNEHGCQDDLIKENYIQVKEEEIVTPPVDPSVVDVFVPTAFTPNGDGENDILFVRGTDVEEMSFLIFNQWGEEIFHSPSKDIGWSGMTRQNIKAQNGNYAYYLEFIDTQGVERKLSGIITLIR